MGGGGRKGDPHLFSLCEILFGYIWPHAKLENPRTTFEKSPPLSTLKLHSA
jgi:hypothetical protein